MIEPITTIRKVDPLRRHWRVVGWLMGASYRTLAQVEGISQSAIGKTVSSILRPSPSMWPREGDLDVDEARMVMALFYAHQDELMDMGYVEMTHRLTELWDAKRVSSH